MSKIVAIPRLLLACTALSWGPVSCENNPTQSKPSAPFADAALRASPPPPGTKAVFYKFGPSDSKIGFTGTKVTKKHEGSFRSFEGRIGLVNADPLMSAVQVDIDLGSLTTDSEKLTGHLKSADFFDVAKFAKANFTSTAIRPGTAASSYNVSGKLTLHGVTKPLTFPATIRITPDAVEVDADLVINRKDYGVVYPGMPDDLIRDDVGIKLEVHSKATPKEGPPAADAHAAD